MLISGPVLNSDEMWFRDTAATCHIMDVMDTCRPYSTTVGYYKCLCFRSCAPQGGGGGGGLLLVLLLLLLLLLLLPPLLFHRNQRVQNHRKLFYAGCHRDAAQ